MFIVYAKENRKNERRPGVNEKIVDKLPLGAKGGFSQLV
jgi:hypothetical protein